MTLIYSIPNTAIDQNKSIHDLISRNVLPNLQYICKTTDFFHRIYKFNYMIMKFTHSIQNTAIDQSKLIHNFVPINFLPNLQFIFKITNLFHRIYKSTLYEAI